MDKKVPKIAILDHVVEEASKKKGFKLSDLEVDTVISVKTRDINFSFKVLYPQEKEVYIWGDYEHFINPKKAVFNGSKLSPHATTIKIDWIGFDMSLEFCITSDEGQRLWISTSYTKKISISDIVIYPNQNMSIN